MRRGSQLERDSFHSCGEPVNDGERIVLQDGRLLVELECGGKLERSEFWGNWVRVEPGAYDKSLIELTGQGKTVRVGRYVRPELRPALAREIRLALRMS